MQYALKTEQTLEIPQSVEAENAVLGSILLDNLVFDVVAELLEVEDFYSELNRRIFACMKQLMADNCSIDLATVYSKIDNRKLLEDAGGIHYLAELPNYVASASKARQYATIVHEMSLLRNVLRIADEAKMTALSQPQDISGFIEELNQKIFSLNLTESRQAYYSMYEVVQNAFSILENRHEHKNQTSGVSTGFADLDSITAGFQNGALYILAARPGMGKTALALNFLTNAAVDKQIPAVFFSLEMTKEELGMRILSSKARVEGDRLRSGYLGDAEWKRVVDTTGTLGKTAIYIDDTPALPILKLQAKARRLKAEKGIGLIIVDYLQLMHASGKNASREQEISEISRTLKAIAKELSIPVIALSQLNRSVESRPNKRPLLSDLRESGAIEQDADVIMFIYRDDYYNDESKEKGISEIIIAKQRAGATGTVKLKWFGSFTLFENLAYESDY
ncbi:MAG: replicative DNA helicase [Bradymonadales bacterium]